MKGLALFNPLLTDLSYTTHMFRIFFARCLAILMLLLSVQNAVGEVDEVLHHDIGAEHTLSVDVPNTDVTKTIIVSIVVTRTPVISV